PHLANLALQLREPLVLGQGGDRLLIAGPDPVQRTVSGDFLQPQQLVHTATVTVTRAVASPPRVRPRPGQSENPVAEGLFRRHADSSSVIAPLCVIAGE